MTLELKRYLFTVQDYHRMAEAGILGEDDRVELIEGNIIKMTPIGSRHVACVKRLTSLIIIALGKQVTVGVQDPILLNDLSEPQPDISILEPSADAYSSAHPGPDSVLLLIEVADTTQNTDRAIKAPLYARNNIIEYWLINLTGETIEVYTDPVDGQYKQVFVARRGDTVTPYALPGLTLQVSEILG